jgi:hypothetical protein
MGHMRDPSAGYVEEVVSWMTVWDRCYLGDMNGPYDDAYAAEMQRLKGLVLGQAAEIEAVLGQIVRSMASQPSGRYKTMGQLAKDVRQLLDAETAAAWASELQVIDRAVKSRNRVAHNSVRIGSSWRDYATGGEERIPVISMLGDKQYDEHDLRRDLALQQEATEAAVRILHSAYRAHVD